MTHPTLRHRRNRIINSPGLTGLLLALAMTPTMASAQAPAAAATPPVLESEEPYTRKLPALSPHWAFIRGGFESGATRIFDGDTGKMVGMVATSRWSDLTLDPTNKFYYVSETIWSKINRGTRQDMLSVYDPVTLNLLSETPVPGRLIIGADRNNFIISDDGKTGFIYNLDPASSVNVVDLEKRRMLQTIELPGCASLMPNPAGGFSALCSDGTLATVLLKGRSATTTHSAPFFSATTDPIFGPYVYDRGKAEATFLTYTGLIYQAKIGAEPKIGEPWSLQAAAGVRPGDTRPLDINWFPSGRQLMALHRATGTLYVLMRKGEFWSHKEGGDEIWVVDLANKRVKRRVPLKKTAENIEISQDAKPLIFINGEENKTRVIDAASFEQKFDIEHAGGGVIQTIDPR
jgi:methylamine dehydrogenase heavy chain